MQHFAIGYEEGRKLLIDYVQLDTTNTDGSLAMAAELAGRGGGADHFGFLDRGDLDTFCAELRGKGVSFKIASTHATNPAQKASSQAAEVLPSAATNPTAEAAASPFMTEPLEPHRADFAA